MANDKTKLVAVIKRNNKTYFVGEIKKVNDSELRSLINICNIHEQEEQVEKRKLLDRISALENKCVDLESEILILKGEK